MRMARKGRSVVLNGILLLITVVVSAVVLEITLRFVFAGSLDFSMEMWKYASQLKEQVNDPKLSFAHVPNRSAFLMGVPVSINSYGHRDREYSIQKPDNTYRIIMLGDSTTFGWGVPVEETIAKTLEAELNKRNVKGYKQFEVLNAGVGNYNTVQEVTHYLTYDRKFSPDLIILQYFINDAEPVPKERDPGVLGRSYLLAFMLSRFDAIMRYAGLRPDWRQYYADLYESGGHGFEDSKRALKELTSIARKDGTTLLVTILPELHEINAEYPFAVAHRKIREALLEDQVPVLELIEGLRGHGPESALFVTPTDAHPNGRASSLVVAQMVPWILQNLETKMASAVSRM